MSQRGDTVEIVAVTHGPPVEDDYLWHRPKAGPVTPTWRRPPRSTRPAAGALQRWSGRHPRWRRRSSSSRRAMSWSRCVVRAELEPSGGDRRDARGYRRARWCRYQPVSTSLSQVRILAVYAPQRGVPTRHGSRTPATPPTA